MNEQTQQAIITVGDGRGFVVGTASRQLVITAAHCLPRFPPAASISHTEERNYSELLGSLGEDAPKVWAECLFADPIGDIAVLGPPDGELVHDEADAYQPVEKGVIDRVSRHGEAYRGEGGFAILRDDEDDLNDQDGSSGRNKHEQGANSARHGLLRGAGADELAHQQR